MLALTWMYCTTVCSALTVHWQEAEIIKGRAQLTETETQLQHQLQLAQSQVMQLEARVAAGAEVVSKAQKMHSSQLSKLPEQHSSMLSQLRLDHEMQLKAATEHHEVPALLPE